MRYQVRGRSTTVDQADTHGGREGGATVIPLYRGATTPPNIAPPPPAPYTMMAPPLTVPYGWRLVSTAGGEWILRHDPAEWSVIARCVEGRRAGRTLEDISAELVAEDAPVWNERRRDYGPARWHPQRVRRLIHRYDPDSTTQAAHGASVRRRALDEEEAHFERMLAEAEAEEAGLTI